MTAAEMVSKLNLPPQTLAAVNNIPLPDNYLELKESFFHVTTLFKTYAAKDTNGLSVLRLYLDWIVDSKAQYDTLGIPEIYFWDSMKDIAIWCDDYLTKYGVPGFKEWEWVGRSLRLEVIRIGRLQFEPIQLSQNVTLSGQTFGAGLSILDVHIPAGEPLTPEAALKSMNRAPEFYKTYFNKEFSLLHCHSWLLSPDLKELLSAHSRIIQFQNLFTVYKTDNEERQAEERVFGFLSDDPNKYPESTSLQKAVKKYMLDGNEVMMGAGIRAV